jgi:phytoene synthase
VFVHLISAEVGVSPQEQKVRIVGNLLDPVSVRLSEPPDAPPMVIPVSPKRDLLSPNADRSLDLIPARLLAKSMTQTYSKSFYLATKLLPVHVREDVYAVYAFCRQSDNIVDAPRQRSLPLISRELVQWREELRAAYMSGESQHPVLNAFVDVALRNNIPAYLPEELISGVEMDLSYDRYPTFDALYRFCYRVASVVGLMMTRIIGTTDAQAFRHAEELGIGMQLANILRDIHEDWRLRGKIYIPQDEMDHFGVTEEQIERGTITPQLRDLLAFQVGRAHSYFEKSEQGISMLTADGQFAVVAASRLYRGILYEIERNGYDVFARRPVVSTYRKVSKEAGVVRAVIERTCVSVGSRRSS